MLYDQLNRPFPVSRFARLEMREIAASLGLLGMRERTELTGGVLRIESGLYEGTKIPTKMVSNILNDSKRSNVPQA